MILQSEWPFCTSWRNERPLTADQRPVRPADCEVMPATTGMFFKIKSLLWVSVPLWLPLFLAENKKPAVAGGLVGDETQQSRYARSPAGPPWEA